MSLVDLHVVEELKERLSRARVLACAQSSPLNWELACGVQRLEQRSNARILLSASIATRLENLCMIAVGRTGAGAIRTLQGGVTGGAHARLQHSPAFTPLGTFLSWSPFCLPTARNSFSSPTLHKLQHLTRVTSQHTASRARITACLLSPRLSGVRYCSSSASSALVKMSKLKEVLPDKYASCSHCCGIVLADRHSFTVLSRPTTPSFSTPSTCRALATGPTKAL